MVGSGRLSLQEAGCNCFMLTNLLAAFSPMYQIVVKFFPS